MKKFLFWLLVFVLAVGGAIAGLWNPYIGEPVGARAYEYLVQQLLGRSIGDDRPDGLLLGVCGAGGPMPNPERTGSCVFVRAGDRVFVVDAGNNAARNIGIMQVPWTEVEAVLLTHFHSDHIDGLGELMLQRWIVGRHRQPLPVYGPAGVGEVVQGFNDAYALDSLYRTAHHGTDTAPPRGAGGVGRRIIVTRAEESRNVIVDSNGLRITAFRVDHDPADPALAYRFDYNGRSLLISGDTSPSTRIQRHAQGVDLLIHAALSPRMVATIGRVAGAQGNRTIQKIMGDIPSYHTSPEDAAKIAGAAEVGHLLLYHIVPPLPSPLLNRVFLGDAAEHYQGPITIATDGTLFFLPTGSKEILQER